MIRFVLDASVSLSWFLDHPMPACATRVKRLLRERGRAVVPALWHLEMANGFAVAERRGLIAPADVDEALTEIEKIVGAAIESETDFFPIKHALATARSFKLSAYDAAYLDTARRNGLPLATLDQSLRAAAARAGVEVVQE